MPLLHDTTKSEKVNALKPFSEVVFYRILIKVDGYDNFTANPQLLKAELFPLKSYVRTNEIKEALAELSGRGLISFYEADGKPFLHLHNNRQKLRHLHAKWPLYTGQVLKEKEPKRKEAKAKVKVKTKAKKEERESNSPPDLKKLKSSLYDMAVASFKKYFSREERQIALIMQETPPEEMTEAKEETLRFRYVQRPILKELDKFMNYYMAEFDRWNTLQVNSRWFMWLERKLEYDKNSKK